MSGALAIVVVAAPKFRARSRVLLRSLRRFHPEVAVLALSVTDVEPPAAAFALATMVRFEQLGVPNLPGFLFRYSRSEIAIAAKPFLLAHALDRGFASALYLDADVWALGDLEGLFRRVRSHALTLSPHRLSPAATAEEELRLLRSGTFNGGVVGVSEGPARRFLAWWQARVHADCRMAPEAGLHHDQRWLDLAPGFLDSYTIETDAGVNAAYWNLDERPIARRAGRWFAGTTPLRLFHFSGFDILNPSRASLHSPSEPSAVAARLFRAYAAAVRVEERATTAGDDDGEYLSRCFADGSRIPDVARSLYAAAPSRDAFGDPLACGTGSFYRWLLEPIALPDADGEQGRSLPRIWLEILRGRPDVARAFPEPCGADHERFVAWAHSHGQGEYGLAPVFLPAA